MERYLGQEPQEVPTERYLATTMMPSDLPAVREAMARAVAAGFRREVPEDKPKRRDLGLEELQKKTGRGGRCGCRWGLRSLVSLRGRRCC